MYGGGDEAAAIRLLCDVLPLAPPKLKRVKTGKHTYHRAVTGEGTCTYGHVWTMYFPVVCKFVLNRYILRQYI